MAIFENVPYGDINNLNLDGIIRAYMSVKGLPEDFQELKDYVMNYFENLDVDSELYQVIQEMLESGEFDEAIQEAIDRITHYNKYSTKEVALTVGAAGCQHTTINSAIDEARLIIAANPGRRVAIFISAGTYREDIRLLPNPGIDLYGEGRNVVTITSTSGYPNGPLYTTGKGYFEGITFISTGATYAFHWENNAQGADVSGTAIFKDCQFSASQASAVGMGTGSGVEVIFQNCTFYSSSDAAVYLHNRSMATDRLAVVTFDSCLFAGSFPIRVDDAYNSGEHDTQGSALMQVFFYNCHNPNGSREGIEIVPDTRTMVRYGYWSVSPNITHYGRGNSIVAMNTGGDQITYAIYQPTINNRYFTLWIENADMYDITWHTLTDGTNDRLNDLQILAQNEHYIFGRVNNATAAWLNMNFTLKAKIGA